MKKIRSLRNQTLSLTEKDRLFLRKKICKAKSPLEQMDVINNVFNNDLIECIDFFPSAFVDLLILDPPYNLEKNFHGLKFKKTNDEEYVKYLMQWFPKIVRLLKPTASIYLCGDWQSTLPMFSVINNHFIVRNRITWQREKGRGAKENWKNCSEDIWYATVGNKYYFDVDAVKLRRKVIAPYKENGVPKDWQDTTDGKFRDTFPSNFWDDITIPFWSMPENTNHSTQKPEKLLAKLILASCPKNGVVFDPFLGSGTTAVVAKKLHRQFVGIEINKEYCLWALKRLELAQKNPTIQGYIDNVFLERNTYNYKKMKKKP